MPSDASRSPSPSARGGGSGGVSSSSESASGSDSDRCVTPPALVYRLPLPVVPPSPAQCQLIITPPLPALFPIPHAPCLLPLHRLLNPIAYYFCTACTLVPCGARAALTPDPHACAGVYRHGCGRCTCLLMQCPCCPLADAPAVLVASRLQRSQEDNPPPHSKQPQPQPQQERGAAAEA